MDGNVRLQIRSASWNSFFSQSNIDDRILVARHFRMCVQRHVDSFLALYWQCCILAFDWQCCINTCYRIRIDNAIPALSRDAPMETSPFIYPSSNTPGQSAGNISTAFSQIPSTNLMLALIMYMSPTPDFDVLCIYRSHRKRSVISQSCQRCGDILFQTFESYVHHEDRNGNVCIQISVLSG